MPRGHASAVGETRISNNGYHYTRTDAGWRLTHHIIAEDILGRPLLPDEMVHFKDGNKKNLDPMNVEVRTKGQRALRVRLEQLKKKRDALNREIAELEAQL